ncbi:DUF4145 domain-containing protein [Phascolarctobacterium faecium]
MSYGTMTCPFCNATVLSNTIQRYFSYHGTSEEPSLNDACELLVSGTFCPNCRRTIFTAKYTGLKMPKNTIIPIYPLSPARQFPDYIPESIRQDYEEAYSILSLSPKASATLSRRCLQGMIRDFWKISERTLFEEITALKDKIPASQYQAIDALRQLGNIGAHMEKDTNLIIDIEPQEAQYLLKLIELLLQQWYVERHEQEKLYADIVDTNTIKQSCRND